MIINSIIINNKNNNDNNSNNNNNNDNNNVFQLMMSWVRAGQVLSLQSSLFWTFLYALPLWQSRNTTSSLPVCFFLDQGRAVRILNETQRGHKAVLGERLSIASFPALNRRVFLFSCCACRTYIGWCAGRTFSQQTCSGHMAMYIYTQCCQDIIMLQYML